MADLLLKAQIVGTLRCGSMPGNYLARKLGITRVSQPEFARCILELEEDGVIEWANRPGPLGYWRWCGYEQMFGGVNCDA